VYQQGAIGNNLGEHIENFLRTHWELEGNTLGTKENEKKFPPFPHLQKNLKEKKIKAL
jgi:hypothetical protein